RVYSRCNDGHYFEGANCPLDGWSSTASREVAAGTRRLAETGTIPSVATLRQVGVGEAALRRAIVGEFGDDASAFEALFPAGYQVNGVWIPSRKFDSRFT